MSEPYYSDDAVTLWHGDCLDVLRTLPDASVDAVVTDPPYNLSDSGKRDRECLRGVLAQIGLPDDQQRQAEVAERIDFATPGSGATALGRIDRAGGERARVGMPERAVHLQHATVIEQEVHDGNESATCATDGHLAAVSYAEVAEAVGLMDHAERVDRAAEERDDRAQQIEAEQLRDDSGSVYDSAERRDALAEELRRKGVDGKAVEARVTADVGHAKPAAEAVRTTAPRRVPKPIKGRAVGRVRTGRER